MPAWLIQTNFTSGSWSDKLIGRVGLAKYQNAAKCMLNMVTMVQGGATRRAGSLYIGATKYPDRRSMLQKFEFSITQTYMLEFGYLYIRIWADRAPVLDGSGDPVEVVRRRAATSLGEGRGLFAQYCGCGDDPPRQLLALPTGVPSGAQGDLDGDQPAQWTSSH